MSGMTDLIKVSFEECRPLQRGVIADARLGYIDRQLNLHIVEEHISTVSTVSGRDPDGRDATACAMIVKVL